jgi:hypothetical protein
MVPDTAVMVVIGGTGLTVTAILAVEEQPAVLVASFLNKG